MALWWQPWRPTRPSTPPSALSCRKVFPISLAAPSTCRRCSCLLMSAPCCLVSIQTPRATSAMWWCSMPASELHAAPIAIVGNLNVDQVVRTVDRYPAWDEEIVVDSSRLELAGTAGYLLLALLGLGIDPFVVSTIGDDPFGAFLEGELAR